MRLIDLRPELKGPAEDGTYHLRFACPCGQGHSCAVRIGGANGWRIAGGTLADLSTLTLEPSIQVTGATECWHGYLRSGVLERV